jgi:G3E family GTPase
MKQRPSPVAVHLVTGQNGRAGQAFVGQHLRKLGKTAARLRVRDGDHLADVLAAHHAGPLVVDAAGIPTLDLIDVVASAGSGRFRLADVIAVVNAPQFFALFDQPCDDSDGPTVLERLHDDIELASVVVLSETKHLRTMGDHARIRDVVLALNPDARFTTEPPRMSAFDLDRCHRDVPWLRVPAAEALKSGSVQAFKYRARRPFHPTRLAATLATPWAGVLRSKGFVWIASRGDERGVYLQGGGSWRLEPAGPWWASIPQADWPRAEADIADIRAVWDLRTGDRRQEIVFVGRGLDSDEIRRDLDACLLDAREMAEGASAWSWLPDPFPPWDDAGVDDGARAENDDGDREFAASGAAVEANRR